MRKQQLAAFVKILLFLLPYSKFSRSLCDDKIDRADESNSHTTADVEINPAGTTKTSDTYNAATDTIVKIKDYYGIAAVNATAATAFSAAITADDGSMKPKRRLPIMSSSSSSSADAAAAAAAATGGVIFFLHVPKTGGTTIRRNVEQLENIHYVFARNYSTYYETAPLVEEAILGQPNQQKQQIRSNTPTKQNNINNDSNKNGTILFYEVHATTAPSFFRLRQRLRRWRDTAERNNVPVFFFTILRDPLSFALSHFKFFHVEARNPTFERCNATEDNFLRLSLENPQCQFLYKGEPSMRAQKAVQTNDGTGSARKNTTNVIVQPDHCQQIQHQMIDLLDWVGTTDNLSNETIPLLAHVLGLNRSFVEEQWTPHKISSIGFDVRNVTAATIEKIHAMSTLDQKLYEEVPNLHFQYNYFFSKREA